MTDYIVERLRLYANASSWANVFKSDLNTAANEIERLQHELDGARLAYRGASYDRDRMRSERDELRREICGYSYDDPHIVAKDRGWNCFKDEQQ